jgi:hypothetical protein
MPTYKFAISEVLHRHTSDMELEADSLEDAMAKLAESVPSPNFYWSSVQREMMVVELSVDDETILKDTRSEENGNLWEFWPRSMVEEGRVWEGVDDDGDEYKMHSLPRRVRDLIDEEEEQSD